MKHEGDHKLDLACLKCVMVHINHKNALLSLVKDFVRVLNHIEIQPNSALHRCAKDLLNKIENESLKVDDQIIRPKRRGSSFCGH